MTNMGTPGNPEGLPHYLTKHFLAQRLGKCLRDDVGFWFCFGEQCDACNGGFVLENILEGVRRVEYEMPFLGYQPDILLWGKDQKKPLRAVEVVATNEPSAGKRRMFEQQGVDLYIVRSHTAEQTQATKQCIDGLYILPAEAQVSCRRKARMRLDESLRRLDAQDDARLGVQSKDPTEKELNDAHERWERRLEETPEDMRPMGPVYRQPPLRRSQTYWIGSRVASRTDLLNLVQFFRYLSVGHGYRSRMRMVREQVDHVWASVLNQNGPFDQPYQPGEWPVERQNPANFKRGAPFPPLRPGTIEWECARSSWREFCHIGRLLWPERAMANPGKWCSRCGGVKQLTVWQAEGQYICEGCRPEAQELLDLFNSPDFTETPIPPELDELFRSAIAELERPITRKDWDPEWGRQS